MTVQTQSKDKISIFWFRRDLRLNDNLGLYQALKAEKNILPVFIFDKHILFQLDDKYDKRVDFIHQAIQHLNSAFKKLKSGMYILYDEPIEAFKKITETFDVSAVYANHDYEPYAIKRDKEIAEFLHSRNIAFHSFKDQVIFEKSEIIKSDSSPYTVFTPYSKKWKQQLAQCDPVVYPSENYLHNLSKTDNATLPSLQEIGFKKTDFYFTIPEINKGIIKNYHLTRNLPSIEGTSRLSVHLRFGTISIRKLVRIALSENEQWLNELIWREFFMMILFHFPQVIHRSFKPKYDKIKWRNNEKEFELWCKGETGFPLVDAGMHQLNATGFMHNRVRMVVASFLVKHLLIDWRWGEAYFANKLLDFELSSNNGNWQWAAGCGCDAAPYFRIFNPTEQARKFDPELKFIRQWIPGFDTSYILPMVDHSFARNRALQTFKQTLNN